MSNGREVSIEKGAHLGAQSRRDRERVALKGEDAGMQEYKVGQIEILDVAVHLRRCRRHTSPIADYGQI